MFVHTSDDSVKFISYLKDAIQPLLSIATQSKDVSMNIRESYEMLIRLLLVNLKFCFLFLERERVLIEHICFCPVKIFTKSSLECAISCWEWLLVARKDLEDEASEILYFSCC